MDLLSPEGKPLHLVENLIGGLRPIEGLELFVVCGDVRENRLAQLRHAGVRTTAQGFLGEQAKESLDKVEPGRVRWCEM